MKKSLIKNNLKEISKTRRRFLSILIMAFLGVGFYSGLVATSPDILYSLDKYVDQTKLFDIDIISTLGLTEEDVDAIKKIDGIESAYGIQTKDSIVQLDNKEKICKVIEYNDNINTPVIISGRLPENNSECLLDKRYSLIENTEDYIGKTVVLQNNDNDSYDNPIFTQKEFKIVGIAESPLYISSERGNTTIGNGNISFYIYVKDNVINMDYYTEIATTIKGTNKTVTNSKEYFALVNPVIHDIENIKEERQNARYNQLINEANDKLNDAQKEYDAKKAEIEQKLTDGEIQINDAKNEITISENKIKKSEKELTSQEKNTEKQFTDADNKIKEAEEEIKNKSEDLENAKTELENSKSEANETINKLNKKIDETEIGIETLQNQKKEMEKQGLDTSEINSKINETSYILQELEKQKSKVETKIKNAEEQINIGQSEINKAKSELEIQKNTLENNKKVAYIKFANARNELNSGKKEIESAKVEIEKKEKELEDGKNEANNKLNEAQQEINEAKDKIKNIEKAKWYIQDRLDNTGYVNILDAIKTMSNISKIFPVIFYIVAILISLTSMTRMIEEERIEIGTLKSLGYTNVQIISKYVLYALLASVIGGFIGMTVGFYLLPNIVWIIYSTIYTIPQFYTTYQINVGLVGILIAFVCIGGATIIVACDKLKEMPAVLMRPKPPKDGKKILLERITFIWKRLNFSKKVTMRNIFRYKKRALMTIIGIAGCTGLMLTGFGIRDSVIDIPTAQYGNIFKYETSISLSNTNGLVNLEKYMATSENIENYSEIYASTAKLKNEKLNYDVAVFIPNENQRFQEVCTLVNSLNDEELTLNNNGIIITNKVAELLNVNVGDKVTFVDSDNIEYQLKIDGITKNYVSHYVYMTKSFYEANIKSYKTNMILVKTKDINEETQNLISKEILEFEGVTSVSSISNLVESINDMLKTMNYVVIILIIASALLDFVVLYNLANINIGERQRELTTLKVLGFYDKEVDNYINKENIIFTIIGVLIGLAFGTFLTNAIIESIEIDKLSFMINIMPISYIYSALITILFSLIVNLIIHFVLKKIDMIESLKSVE